MHAQQMNLGIYIQVPFCQTKCTYCNFHTGVASPAAYAPYARAVEHEIRNWRDLFMRQKARDAHALLPPDNCITGSTCNTIYVGGGTPSLFDPADLAPILAAVRSQFGANRTRSATLDSTNAPLATRGAAPAARRTGSADTTESSPEVTLEADPETITPEKAAAWLAAGINRISLGAQSFHDAELKSAGRMHRSADIFSAVASLRAVGFTNISLDLIAGLPHQTPGSWHESIDEALRLRPEHISIYLFEIDQGSRLGRELLSGGSRYSAGDVPSDDAMAESYEFACAALARAGYEHYEISNWALPGFRSQHNLKYWRREPYLGFGAGAHSFDGRWRWANAHDPAAYAAAIEQGRLPVEQLEEVTPRQALDEELFLGLRQLEGIDLAQIAARYGAQFESGFGAALDARIDDLLAQGLVERQGSRVRLAPARLAVSNEVFVALLD